MPPEQRFVCRFAAEPPQEPLAAGAWADELGEHFREACSDLGAEPGPLVFYPDRTWEAVTFVPVTAPTDDGGEVFGFVDFARADEETPEPHDFDADADVAEEAPDATTLDLNQHVVGHWRGEGGEVAEMTLVWGRALVPGGTMVTAELGGIVVDQCGVVGDRFTLLAPDAYGG